MVQRGSARAGAYALARGRMVERLASAGIRDRRVLDAMRAVPRHVFVPEALASQAYEDTALPIGDGQTISAPGIVAAMSQALELEGGERALEIGTGSGYQVAVLSRLVGAVVSIERLPRLAARARRALDAMGVANVVVHLGDGSLGRPAAGPFDAILVTAGGPAVPQPLLDQLAPGGRLVGPFGGRGAQRLTRVRRGRSDRLAREDLAPCRFVDLIGGHGWVR
ncbi:MAG: protein-L-isoaspartate(D-aspartate) O-methyltransferase [Deltaproteobacteria bacterium]|nr:MAG: protein-L-isoaspartate(D-aspartate) O-methyltransferase [Deltaproteobacteria bacterium]